MSWPTGHPRVHPVNGEVPPVKGRPRKLPHYANRGKTSSSGGELASALSCFSTVRTALGKLRIAGLLAQFDVARSFPQFPRPLLLQPTILTSERGTRFGIRKPPNHVPPPHLPDDPIRGHTNPNWEPPEEGAATVQAPPADRHAQTRTPCGRCFWTSDRDPPPRPASRTRFARPLLQSGGLLRPPAQNRP